MRTLPSLPAVTMLFALKGLAAIALTRSVCAVATRDKSFNVPFSNATIKRKNKVYVLKSIESLDAILFVFRWPTSGGATSRTRSVCLYLCLYLSGHLT